MGPLLHCSTKERPARGFPERFPQDQTICSLCKSLAVRHSPCLFLFKEGGRPISLPRVHLFHFLIFQSSGFMAFRLFIYFGRCLPINKKNHFLSSNTPSWGRTRAAMPVYPPERDPVTTLVALGWPLTPCFPSHCPEALEPWEGVGWQ